MARRGSCDGFVYSPGVVSPNEARRARGVLLSTAPVAMPHARPYLPGPPGSSPGSILRLVVPNSNSCCTASDQTAGISELLNTVQLRVCTGKMEEHPLFSNSRDTDLQQILVSCSVLFFSPKSILFSTCPGQDSTNDRTNMFGRTCILTKYIYDFLF